MNISVKDFNAYSFLYVIKYIYVNDCFVICVGTSLLLECDMYFSDLFKFLSIINNISCPTNDLMGNQFQNYVQNEPILHKRLKSNALNFNKCIINFCISIVTPQCCCNSVVQCF